ncbi:MAG: ParB/RepB/Spo0J family partition protein [Prevotella sp.]|nr:ParB/RepB/Spo0J family partition protein [Alistipes senegalensis]MCM1357210.1 ParB/RepB/Spo0J family partition protein [Prevotella sp.]MCM1473598.1 ParB/RepB/Spo0J family partition protein [Muribaculaceae bacterium]
MAKMMLKNLGAIVANTLTDSIKMIDIDELHNSEDNFFDINRIEEFAETILGQGGIKDNLVVRPLDDGGYEIISGHRRRAAVQYLLDNGENISRYLPCLVQSYDDNDDKLLDIVLLNVSSRQISDSEMWKSYEVVDRILQNKKSAGEKFGRVRDKLAEYLGVSTSQVRKIQNIDNNAIEPVKEAISNGEISISTANEIARLDENEQEEIMKSTPDKISHKDVKKMNDNKKVDTCVTFSKDDTVELDEEEEIKIDDDFSENDISEYAEEIEEVNTYDKSSKKVDTCVTFSEDNIAELDEETDIDDDFSENDVPKLDEPETEMTLAEFVYKHYFDIESILTAYVSMIDMTDDSDDFEIELIEKFQKLLYQTKEAERNKARLKP